MSLIEISVFKKTIVNTGEEKPSDDRKDRH